MSGLVLSLFPGIGLLDMAFEQEGFCVVRGPDVLWGGDIRNFHPPAGKFDGVIGGPPCQAFSRLAHMVRQNGYEPKFGNLIPEFERCVMESRPQWFLMENVPDAPVPFDGPYTGQPLSYGARAALQDMNENRYGIFTFLLNNRQCFDEDGQPATQNRVRRWSFGWRGARRILGVDVAVFENGDFEYAATGGSARPVAIGGSGKLKKFRDGKGRMPWNSKSQASLAELLRKQGLPDDFLRHAPFTVEAKRKAVGNGVPLPMGRAIAKAVREAVADLDSRTV